MHIKLSNLDLAYNWHGFGPDKDVAIVIHGIMGNKKNWASFADRLANQFPDTSFLAVDLRNHGESNKHVAPYTIEACAQDLVELTKKIGYPVTRVIGHSFGGKVALLTALGSPQIKAAWVLDAPLDACPAKALDRRDGLSAFHIMEILFDAPSAFSSRRELVDFMRERGAHESIALWMTTNLIVKNDALVLNFDPHETYQMLLSFVETNIWPLIPNISRHCNINLVKAEHGERIGDDAPRKLQELAGKNGVFSVVNNASHFLHIDNPHGLLDVFKNNWR